MKKLSLIFSLLFLLLSISTSPLIAAVPKLIAFEGLLKNASDSYLTGTYAMTFRIYEAASGGTAAWSETQSTVSVTSGRFSIQLGSVNLLDLSFIKDYWLSVQVGTDPEMAPRVRLTTVGYAYMAQKVVEGFSQDVHDGLSHKNIQGVKSNTSLIAKTNFKLDAYTKAVANNMGDMILDTFSDSSGLSASLSTGYKYRGTPDYDVVVQPADPNTVLLGHMNGTDGSVTFSDSGPSNHSVTPSGNAQVDTAQSKFGGAGLLLDGVGDYLTVPDSPDWDFGTGDFTIDFWVRFADVTNSRYFFSRTSGGVPVIDLRRGSGSANLLIFTLNNVETNLGLWNASVNTWYHVAMVRSGTSVKVFVDGSQFGATATDSSDLQGTGGVAIGAYASGSEATNGWIDEFRVSKGIARWTANFTPPTEEYSSSAGGPATVVSVAFPESAAPKETMVIPEETLNTGSITYYVSRDNGTTWTQCAKNTIVNVDSQPSGTQVRWKTVISGNAELESIAVAL